MAGPATDCLGVATLKNLALIPARSGSTGLPGKNLLKIEERSLVQRAIDVARESGCFEGGVIALSTDINELLDSPPPGVTVLSRPATLTGGDVEIVDVMAQVLAVLGSLGHSFDTICLLNPTSPFRDRTDLQECYRLFRKLNAQTALTVTAVHPIVMTHHKRGVRKLYHVARTGYQNRQKRTPVMVQTGAVYVVDSRYFGDTKRLVGDRVACVEVPKYRSLDIDDAWDYLAALAWAPEIKRMQGVAPPEVIHDGGIVQNATPPAGLPGTLC